MKKYQGSKRETDKLVPIPEIFSSFTVKCKHFYCAEDQLTIDEKLEAYMGRCSFLQYIPNKPTKYG